MATQAHALILACNCKNQRVFHLQGLHDFLPVRNIRTLVPQIRTLEGKCDFLGAQFVMLLRQYPINIVQVRSI